MSGSESEFLVRAAPALTRVSNRFFTADSGGVSYPTSAQARIAEIEEQSFWFRQRNETIVALVGRFPPAGPIVEVGGGNGFVSLGLARHGFSAVVVEPGADGADIAHRRGLAVVRGCFTRDMFAVGTVPAIGLFDVIEHLEDDETFLADCARAMETGGLLYITVPAFGALWSSDDKYAGHYRRYSRATLARVLHRAGFDILFSSAFFAALVMPLFLLRSLPSALGFRKVTRIDQAVDHHIVAPQIAAILDRLHRTEVAALTRGHALPLGTSLIAVAQKAA